VQGRYTEVYRERGVSPSEEEFAGNGETGVLVLIFPEDGVIDYCIAQYVGCFSSAFLRSNSRASSQPA
jgi:hypothetical protein